MDSGWVSWPLFAVYVVLWFKAFGLLLRRSGSSEPSGLEVIGALYLAPLLAPLMPFVWLAAAVERRRDRVRVTAGLAPLSLAERQERRHVVVGAVLLTGFAGVVVALLLGVF